MWFNFKKFFQPPRLGLPPPHIRGPPPIDTRGPPPLRPEWERAPGPGKLLSYLLHSYLTATILPVFIFT